MSVDYKVRQIYNVVIKEVTETQESWKSVLRLAGQIYRYEFDNVLMVYAQKPHATLVADFDTWKKVGRYVKRGSKGIAIYPSKALQPYMRYVFESAAYVDMLESKLDQMTNELVQMRKELQEMKEQQASKSLKETLSEMVDRAQARCQQMKEKLFEVKEEMHNKAAEIVKSVKRKGKEALNKVSEFFGVKKKLESIRENVREGIVETDQTLARIDGFGEGMRMANQQLANSFRVLAGKEQVDYSKKEYAQSNVAVIRKPWEWQKKVYQNLELHLDAAIDKVDILAKAVELQRMEKKWDELYEQTHQESKEAAQPQILSMVSEPEYEYGYGAEAFEAFQKNNAYKSDTAIVNDDMKKIR